MAKKKELPVWKVLYHEFNKSSIEYVNVFEFGQFSVIFKELKNIISKFKKKWKDVPSVQMYLDHQEDLEWLKKEVDDKLARSLCCYFWAKCEYEVIVSQWPPHYDYKSIKDEIKKMTKEDPKWYSNIINIDKVINAGNNVETKIDIFTQITANYSMFKLLVFDYIGLTDYLSELKESV